MPRIFLGKAIVPGYVLGYGCRYFVSINVNDALTILSPFFLEGGATRPVDLVKRSTGDPSDPSKMGSNAKVVQTPDGLAFSRILPVRQTRRSHNIV